MRQLLAATMMLLFFAANSEVMSQDKPVDTTDKVALNDKEKAAKDFKFENIVLGMELEAFRTRFPKIDKATGISQFIATKYADKKIGREAFYLSDDDGYVKAADGIVCMFFESKLYEIRIIYDEDALTKLGGSQNGGVEILVKRLKDKFGDPTDSFEAVGDGDTYCLSWVFKRATRHLQLDLDEKNDVARLFVTDTAVVKKMKAKAEEAADTGF